MWGFCRYIYHQRRGVSETRSKTDQLTHGNTNFVKKLTVCTVLVDEGLCQSKRLISCYSGGHKSSSIELTSN